MIIECSYCEAAVDATVLAQHKDPIDPDEPMAFRASFLVCPRCGNALLGGEDLDSDEPPFRLWPQPKKYYSPQIPVITRESLDEANACFKARAYSACAVMCGRSIEGICRHFKTKAPYLGAGLKELRERGVIDGRLMEWAQELQKSRNLGAHASEEKVSRQDANDLLDFTNAICEYTFVLAAKFERFMKRRKGPTKP